MPAAEERWDAVVVGSGFGGSVAAFRLAEGGRRVLLLERGQPYRPGTFARTPREMRANFWEPSSGLYGLFDLWSFGPLDVLQSSGLGGGSLIYANVMLRKDADTFVCDEHECWPISQADLEPHYERVAAMQRPRPIPGPPLPKTDALFEAAARLGLPVERPPLAVEFAAEGQQPGEPIPGSADNLHGITRTRCRLCGECDVGCNYGAKTTLDLTYLSGAQRAGATIRCCCDVEVIARAPEGYVLEYRQHVEARGAHPPELLDPEREPLRRVSAPLVVLAAGAIGTTRLLLANRASLPNLSPALGTRFSGNGDYLGMIRGTRRADGQARFLDPSHGPVITASVHVDEAHAASGRGFRLQDGGAPSFADWLWQMTEAPGDVWRTRGMLARRTLARLRGRRETRLSGLASAMLGDSHVSAAMMPVLGMGRDVPGGRFRLDGERLVLDWPGDASGPYFDALRKQLAELASAMGGSFAADPLDRMSRAVSAHPVGGAPMSADWRSGVTDPHGQVHGHPGLWVTDGAAMPGPVGANPSFTIAAFADRAADAMLADA
ncbi:MAG: GMC oxidoreductase [Solirubrobacteraceae bacterium]